MHKIFNAHIIWRKKSIYSMASSYKLTLVQQPCIVVLVSQQKQQQQETKFMAKTSASA